MKKLLLILLMAISHNLIAQQWLDVANNVLDQVAHTTAADFNNLKSQVQTKYPNKFTAFCDYKFSSNHGNYVYCYYPTAKIVNMFFFNNDGALSLSSVIIDDNCTDCNSSFKTPRPTYNQWLGSLSVTNTMTLPGYLNDYVRVYLMFNPTLKTNSTAVVDSGLVVERYYETYMKLHFDTPKIEDSFIELTPKKN